MAAALLHGVTTKCGQIKPEGEQQEAGYDAPASRGAQEVQERSHRDAQDRIRSFRWGCVGGAWSRSQVWRTGCWKVETLLD